MSRFRASRSTRSGRPATQNDQDIFDGLPIRQWRFQPSSIAAPEDVPATGPALDAPLRGQGTWIEFSMPKGSEHYPSWCQQILREARLGRIVSGAQDYTRDVFGRTVVEDEKDNETGPGEMDEGLNGLKRARTEAQGGFTANKWSQTARHLEEPEFQYLAKRRKGLPSVHGGLGPSNAPGPVSTSSVGVVAVAPGIMPVNSGTLKKTKVKRVDAQGQVKVWEVLVPQGHPIEGELIEATLSAEDAAIPVEKPESGTVVEGLGVAGDDGAVIASFSAIPTLSVNVTPLPPRGSRKKQKGFRKGRSKKLGVGDGGGVSAAAESLYPPGVQFVDESNAAAPTMDVDMAETPNPIIDAGEGSEEGEIDEDDGDEGEGEGDEDEHADADMLEDPENDGDNEDGLGDEDREEGELTPDPGDASELRAQFQPTPNAPPTVTPKILHPPPSTLPARPPTYDSSHQPGSIYSPRHPSGLSHVLSADLETVANTARDAAMTGVVEGASIEELATEPSVPVGAELLEASNLAEDQEMAITPADTESSYDPPEPSLPTFGRNSLLDQETDVEETVDRASPTNATGLGLALEIDTISHSLIKEDALVPSSPGEASTAMDIDEPIHTNVASGASSQPLEEAAPIAPGETITASAQTEIEEASEPVSTETPVPSIRRVSEAEVPLNPDLEDSASADIPPNPTTPPQPSGISEPAQIAEAENELEANETDEANVNQEQVQTSAKPAESALTPVDASVSAPLPQTDEEESSIIATAPEPVLHREPKQDEDVEAQMESLPPQITDDAQDTAQAEIPTGDNQPEAVDVLPAEELPKAPLDDILNPPLPEEQPAEDPEPIPDVTDPVTQQDATEARDGDLLGSLERGIQGIRGEEEQT